MAGISVVYGSVLCCEGARDEWGVGFARIKSCGLLFQM